MKKKPLISALATLLAVMLLSLSCGALAESAENKTCGILSYLNMTEDESDEIAAALYAPMLKLLFLQGVLEELGDEAFDTSSLEYHFYDSLNALLMALQAEETDAISVPFYTGRYLCSANNRLALKAEYHPEKASGVADFALSVLSDGYSFMLKEENAELRDALDAQIAAMKGDGTLQKLIDEHIVKPSIGEAPTAIAFYQFEGDPIRVAVTGSLPPMDYVAENGTFAGFNTAILAEIGRRLQRNIELVQVDSIGRALALSEGTVDVVFWTRGASEALAERLVRNRSAGFGLEAQLAEVYNEMTDEEKAILGEAALPNMENVVRIAKRDLPEGTISTQPYFSDFPVIVVLK